MTNREAFNRYIREKAEEQIAYMERMSDEELVDYTIKVPGYHVEVKIGDELCYFKLLNTPAPIGSKKVVTEWLGQEFSDKKEE